MKFIPSWLLAALMTAAVLLATPALAANREINGVKVEESVVINGVPLQINGAGTRYKAIFKVYVAALYLGQKAVTPAEVLAQTGPKRLSLTMVRDIDAAELGKLLTRGMEDNMGRPAMSKLVGGLMRMSQIFSDQKKMVSGDDIQIDWIPGTGTVITAKGKVQGEPFKEPEFFEALMSIWLGPSPADHSLKEALLGTK